MATENSAVVALSHLRELEADRVRREEHARRVAADAERHARELEAKRERALAEQWAAQEAERLRTERMARLERERQDRLRVREAEARARVAHDVQLRTEQMRLEAQLRLSEGHARPRWPLAVVPVLVLAVLGAAGIGWHNHRLAEQREMERADAEQAMASTTDVLERLNAKLAHLEAEQGRLQQDRTALEAQLAAAKDDEAAAAELQKKIDAVDASIATNDRAQRKAGRRKGRRGKGTTTRRPKPTPTTDAKPPRRTPRLEFDNGNDPLAGAR